jgi:hypothetical protein
MTSAKDKEGLGECGPCLSAEGHLREMHERKRIPAMNLDRGIKLGDPIQKLTAFHARE